MEVVSMIIHKEYTKIAHVVFFIEVDGTHWLPNKIQ